MENVIVILGKPSYMNKEGKIIPALVLEVGDKKLWYAPIDEFLPSQLYPSEKTKNFFDKNKNL